MFYFIAIGQLTLVLLVLIETFLYVAHFTLSIHIDKQWIVNSNSIGNKITLLLFRQISCGHYSNSNS